MQLKPNRIRKSIGYLVVFTAIVLSSCNNTKPDFINREQNFDSDWKFNLGDVSGAELARFDDSKWRVLDLPHDLSIEDLPTVEGKNKSDHSLKIVLAQELTETFWVESVGTGNRLLSINPNKIGIAGFSAGGFMAVELAAADEINESPDRISWKPNFAGLFYAAFFKNYTVRKESCPSVFIINAADDKLSTAPKCIDFYTSLLNAGVSAEMHIYNKVSHGFSMDFSKGESLKYWTESFLVWFKDIRMIQRR